MGQSKEYKADWYRLNRERLRARGSAWYQENKAKAASWGAAYYAANKERISERMKAYREKKENQLRARLRTKEWRDSNLERARTTSRDWARANPGVWAKRNPGRKNAHTAARKAMSLGATPAWANQFFIAEAYDLANRRTDATGYEWHVDHIVPLQNRLVCGLHVESNLRVIPASHNCAKGNRYWPDMPS